MLGKAGWTLPLKTSCGPGTPPYGDTKSPQSLSVASEGATCLCQTQGVLLLQHSVALRHPPAFWGLLSLQRDGGGGEPHGLRGVGGRVDPQAERAQDTQGVGSGGLALSCDVSKHLGRVSSGLSPGVVRAFSPHSLATQGLVYTLLGGIES